MFNINFADDWIQTIDIWYWIRQLYQLSHNHFPRFNLEYELKHASLRVCVTSKRSPQKVSNNLLVYRFTSTVFFEKILLLGIPI